MSFLIAAMMMAAATADVDCPTGGDPSIPRVRANWKTPLSADSVMWAYPPQAVASRQGGKAVIHCTVDVEGKATDCFVVSETPVGLGFGEAAISLHTQMEFTPELRCGKPTPSSVTIPITFSTPPERKASKEAMPALTDQLLGRRLALALRVGDDAEADLMAYGSAMLYRTDRPVPPEQRRALYQMLQETRPKARQIMVEAAGVALAREMSSADLETAVAFYEGPVGQALVRAQGAFRYQAGNEAQAAGATIRNLLDTQFCAITAICKDEAPHASGN
ncbi:hypothetical protein DMC25_08775 [Caulobacter sp. D4A]|uniref:TonB family protein n=1 Tax=unclassified Caulobacter TaxID=2648921 RepID=UPI000D73B19A|nr:MULTISPECIES: TonB family protein [unclassified Caulobacter]PXA87648.1 hypothetical protein DMC18_20600 [Caulobacter sp. D5]PXA89880.1 hypothetical protein DMC25_08775 [Caulobacter sp. D4A]